jgi:phosphatidylglycerophosphatase A
MLIAILLHVEYGAGRGMLVLLAAILLVPGIWSAGVTAKRAQLEDPRFVVVDEVIGQWVTLAGASVGNWKSWLAAFVLFRILDVWKPPPVRQLERLPGGFGIVADDVMAGLYGALAIFVLERLQVF